MIVKFPVGEGKSRSDMEWSKMIKMHDSEVGIGEIARKLPIGTKLMVYDWYQKLGLVAVIVSFKPRTSRPMP